MLSGSFSLGASTISSDNLKLLSQLDEIIANHDVYVNRHQARIDSLKALPSSGADKHERIADSYYNFQIDSAIAYYGKAHALAINVGDSIGAERINLKRLSLMPLTGAVRECLNEFEAINPLTINKENLGTYYGYGSQLYFFTLSYYQNIPHLYNEYGQKATTLAAEAGKAVTRDSLVSRYYTEIGHLVNDKKGPIAAANLAELLESIDPLHPFYTRIAMALHHYYKGANNEEMALKHLLLSAIADALAGTREEMALLALGEYLYEKGDVDRAYTYMTSSLANAVASGASSRSIEASRYVPLIVAASDSQSNTTLYIMTALVVALLITVAVIVYSLRMQREKNSKVRAMTTQLAEANKLKERHIADFINLLSSHLEQLEQNNKYTIRKIKAQQIDDLLKTLTSDSHKSSNLKTFYEIFDNAFLNMYPSFISKVNELRVPEKRTYDPDAKTLTNDLRILAFMRLGINDGDKIARFLGVSINTIYTYRNKFRSAAINRDTFEADIRAIDSIA